MSARINLIAPEVRADPYPCYAELRRQPTLTQVDPGGFWAVSRHADVLHVLKNPQLFSQGQKTVSQPAWMDRYNYFLDSLVFLDPPRHTRLRALVNRAFGPGTLTRLEPFIREVSRQAAEALPLGRTVDFVEAFSLRVPASVIGELLGLEASLHPRFRRWAEDVAATSTTRADDHERQARIRESFAEMEHHLGGLLEARRKSPREDLVSELLAARIDGEALSHKELMGFLYLLLFAGLETTLHLLSHCALMFTRRPELLPWLREEPARMGPFIEEMLRYEPPAHSVLRLTTEEVELGGVRLPADTRLLVLVGSALRDEACVPEPERFLPEREGAQNLVFGHGIHFCLGAALARLEARLALEALVGRCGRLSREPEPVQWNASLLMRGPKVLPLTLHPV